jgi:predicted AlkP superfamily phosphohydrolase/phosphomutase/Tfp pilus assembly protein PilF
MPRRRLLHFTVLLLALTALMYVLVSLYLPSPRRLIFGVDKNSGRIRRAEQGIGFLPPHQFYRMSFERRDGAAQRDGSARIVTREGVPVTIFYRLRFTVEHDRLPDARRLVRQGWTAWINARVAEAVAEVARQVPIEELSAPGAELSRNRQILRSVVANHLTSSGLSVKAFEISRIEIDTAALLEFKRAELRRKARGPVGPVALFAIDGADWELLLELMTDGHLPNIRALIDRGVSASVTTIAPTISPLLWTTVATGVRPDRHGVIDFFDPREQNAAVSASSRRAPALWEISDAFNRKAVAVNWWTGWPPLDTATAVYGMPSAMSGSLHSQVPIDADAAAVPVETVGHQQLSRFMNIPPSEVERLEPNSAAGIFRRVLAKTWTDHRVGMELYRAHRPMLFMLHFEGSDTVNHLFGPFHPPLRVGVNPEGYRRYWATVAAYYAELDRLIGEWMRVLPDETTVMVVSAHGFHWGKERPKEPPAGTSALGAHRSPGFFVAYGPRIQPSRARQTISIYDIAPTVLSLLGLPKSHEMTGEFAQWAFADVQGVTGVDVISYRDLMVGRPVAARGTDAATYRAELQQVGHVADPNRMAMPMIEESAGRTLSPEQWGLYAYLNNRGVELKQQNELRQAAETFQKAIEMNPGRPIAYLNLSIVNFDRQQYTAAEELLFAAIARGLPNPEQYVVDYATLYRERNLVTRAVNLLTKGQEIFPESYLIAANRGAALASTDRLTEALPELERALGLRPTSTTVLNNLGLYWLKRKEPARALDYWNRSLAIDPRQTRIREAVAATEAEL